MDQTPQDRPYLAPSDQQNRTHRIERRTPVRTAQDRLGSVERKCRHPREREKNPRGPEPPGRNAMASQLVQSQKQRHDGQIDGWSHQRSSPPRSTELKPNAHTLEKLKAKVNIAISSSVVVMIR
ncbi:hypothetical protein ACRYCC_28130 [Actinomadura scrupuli]|uniref:hypothetical protein n=1 Tax=Actinomadura scrupuli TaxID=559629 RepID=UPI003D95FF14